MAFACYDSMEQVQGALSKIDEVRSEDRGLLQPWFTGAGAGVRGGGGH